MDWETLLGMLRNPPAEGPPETIYDDLDAAYNGVLEGSQARDAEHAAALAQAETDGNTRLEAAGLEHETAVAELQAEIAQLKSQNYDLMMQVGLEPEGSENPQGDAEVDAGENVAYEDMFTDDEPAVTDSSDSDNDDDTEGDVEYDDLFDDKEK